MKGERENMYLQLYFTSMDTRPLNWSKCQSFSHFCSLICISANESIMRYLVIYYILLMMAFDLSKANYDEIFTGEQRNMICVVGDRELV